MLRKTLLLLTLVLFIACGDTDYQEEWVGSWRDTDSGLQLTFNTDGTISAEFLVQGVVISSENAGQYTVDEHTYTLTIFRHDAFDAERQDDSGTWERKGDRIELESDKRGLVILRKLEDE